MFFRDGLAYPLTGGLSRPAMVPAAGVRMLRALERLLPQAWWKLTGWRMLIVIERRAG